MCTFSGTAAAFCISMFSLVLIVDSARIINDSSSDFWRNWLFIIDDGDSSSNLSPSNPYSHQGIPARRITPKSVFIAPSFSKCPEGYKSDGMGICVKIVRVDEAAQWNFLLEKLNAMYATSTTTDYSVHFEDATNFETTSEHYVTSYSEDNNTGPFQLPIPVSNISDIQDENVSLSSTFFPSMSTSPGDYIDLQSAADEYDFLQVEYYSQSTTNLANEPLKIVSTTDTPAASTSVNIRGLNDKDDTTFSVIASTDGNTFQLSTNMNGDNDGFSNGSSEHLPLITTNDTTFDYMNATTFVSNDSTVAPVYQMESNINNNINNKKNNNRKCNLKYHQCQQLHQHYQPLTTSQKVHIVSPEPYFNNAYNFVTTTVASTVTTATTVTDASTITDLNSRSLSTISGETSTIFEQTEDSNIGNDGQPLDISITSTDYIITANTATNKAPVVNNGLLVSKKYNFHRDRNYWSFFTTSNSLQTTSDAIESSTANSVSSDIGTYTYNFDVR